MKRITNLILMAAMAAATPLWAADVNDVKARQRWPWNGLVDITCTVSGIDGTDYGPDFFVFDPLGVGVATDRTVPPADTTEKSGGAESSSRRASATSFAASSFAAAPAPASAQTERGIVFAAQPEDRTVEAGESVTFSVEARNYLGFTASLSSGVGLEMVWCPPGTFEMGSPDDELGRDAKETRHTVVLTQGFWIGRYEVTQPQYQAVMGMNPSSYNGDDRPVDSVSFRDALNFSERLTANEMSAGRLPKGYLYTLPTEAQWEYACRAGTTKALNSGKDLSSAASCDEMGEVGWYEDNAGNATHAVGQKPSNAWGLHDMHGNVSEWCWDFYKADYPSGTVTNPPGPWSRVDGYGSCVFRGGSWHTSAQSCRSAARGHDFASHGGPQCGFRLALARNRSVTVPLAANAEMEMVWIGAGTFTMGSPTGELGRQADETQHAVTLTRDFWLGMFEVTQKQYETVMGTMPDAFDGSKHGRDDDMPVYFVSRDEALAFCAALTERERAAGRLPAGYRFALPTEAQWEYACRAGTTKALNNDHNLTSTTSCSSVDQVGWYKYNSGLQVHPTHVAREPNNPHYLVFLPYYRQYDMHGNVREWVADRYGAYPSGAATDPTGPESGDVFILRGGGFDDEAWMCRSAMRIRSDGSAEDASGFRVAIVSVEGAAANPDELYPVEEPELLTGGMSYQWYKDGAAIAGATGASLTIAAATAADAGRYTVDVWCQNVTNRAAAVLAVTLPPVPYLDPVNHTTNLCETYTLYTDQTELTSGWYVVSGDITNDTRIAVSGDVNLILKDDASLTANAGVNVDVDGTITNSLTIWAQSDGKGMGSLTVPSPPDCCAGIGGDRSQGDGRHAGNLVINGGRITAQGGNFAAGIGGGHYYGFFGDDELPGNGGGVTVNGGAVTAAGGSGGAGIGGGELGNGGTVTISGGEVTAQGGSGAVGIGGGFHGSGGTVTVKPSAGTAVAVAVGEDAGSAAPIDGSPFMAETDVTGRVEGKKFVRTWEPQFHAVTVVGGSTTNSPALEGSVVTVVADEPEPGHAFVQWARCDGVDFADASAAETTFTMPTNDVTVTAVFAEIRIGGLDGGGYPWTGRPVEPEVAVSLKGVDMALRRGTDYAVSYADNVDPGTATLTVTMLPPGLGSRTATFTILPRPSVSNVAAAVRGPWNGKVELTFATDGNWSGLSGWNAPVLSIVATDHLTGSNYVADVSALSARAPYQLADALAGVPGPHEVTWDFTAQGIDFSSTNVTFTVAYLKMPDYCVIDLSGGTNATSYAVSYLDAEPDGGFTNDLYRTTNLVMRLIGPGTFKMGVDGSAPNNPPHSVTLTQPFYCAVFETTQRQWELVMGNNPSYYKGAMRPVEQVSWNMICSDSDNFLGVLRSKTGLDTLDLPTEAQWEYACRAGTTNRYNGVDTQDLGQLGRYGDNSVSGNSDGRGGYSEHTAVGSYLPNAWGLYDMHGNVFEWCFDWWNGSLANTSVTNPLSYSGSGRVLRGGGWYGSAYYCTSSYRGGSTTSSAGYNFGFRLVRTLSDNLESERSAEAAAGAERAGTVCAGTSASIAVGMREFADTDIKLTPYDAPYDGQPHAIGIETNAIAGLELRYASGALGESALPFGDVPPTFTDVTNVTVWVEANAPGYFAFTTNATVTITPRTVSLTSGSASKTYDGSPVTCADVLVGADGFAPGEGATFEVTGSQTHFGSSENFFTYTLNAGTSAWNYEISTSNGTLTVTKATNAWTADPSIAGWTYGEAAGVPDFGGAAFGTATVTYSAEPGDAGDYTATFTVAGTDDYDGLTFEVPFTIARATFAAGYEGVYDGEGHGIGIETNAIDGLVLRYAVGEGGSPGGLALPSGGHGVPALPFGDTPPTFTDATNVTVWVEASAPNYETVTNSATITIVSKEMTDDDADIDLELPEGGYVGDGTAKMPPVSVMCDGRQLVEGVDYDVSYSDNVEPGTATVTVTFKGNYFGIVKCFFGIAAQPEPEPQPEPQPEPPAGRRVLWPTDAPFQLDRMTTYNGYLLDANANDAVVGVIAVKAGKPSKNTGVSRLTVTIRLTGQKAITVRGRTVDGTFRAMAGGRALDIALGLHSLSGAFGSYLVDGSRDMFAARDADSKSRAAQALSRWKGNYVAAWQAAGATDAPYNTLSITVKKKGRVTVKGTLANGTRVSANTHLLVGGLHRRMGTGSLLLVGEKECAVAVSWAKKGSSVACLLWFGEDGTVSCESLNDGSVAVAAPVGAGLAAGATLRIDQAAVAAAFPGISVERSFPGGVPAKLSLRYGKDGTFNGSFKVYVDSGVSFRQKTVKVSGVVLDGIGYGVAYVKNIGDWKITIE